MTTATRPAPNHDTLTCYTHYGCRLTACVERYLAWDRARSRALAEGTWQPLVDAEPVRAHLRAFLARDLTLFRAAQLASVNPHVIYQLFNRRPRQHTIRAEIARKILAVDPKEAPPPFVDAIGTVRRIQALVAAGWPMRYLEPRLGIGHNVIQQTLARAELGRPVLSTTAVKVAEGYERLLPIKPPQDGVPELAMRRARALAAKRKWAPARYWAAFPGCIDDPHFESMYGLTRGDRVVLDALWLEEEHRYPRAVVAERLGMERDALDRAIARWRNKQGAAA